MSISFISGMASKFNFDQITEHTIFGVIFSHLFFFFIFIPFFGEMGSSLTEKKRKKERRKILRTCQEFE